MCPISPRHCPDISCSSLQRTARLGSERRHTGLSKCENGGFQKENSWLFLGPKMQLAAALRLLFFFLKTSFTRQHRERGERQRGPVYMYVKILHRSFIFRKRFIWVTVVVNPEAIPGTPGARWDYSLERDANQSQDIMDTRRGDLEHPTHLLAWVWMVGGNWRTLFP